ncbi:LemA family protein [Roseibium porphyridii]|uniref:LemA family protein n=1 Tax=Roseibium porphyridii TaxID=2866279 RepID=A0ABY8F1R9_9HYPH|nr:MULTISPECIES: LemA family protein [Stappiaceae]QFT34452.1 LemA family protein [Labrenzia sp. THAF82]WFE89427.1 LemA family protein [Roseibium sp. KMA01]
MSFFMILILLVGVVIGTYVLCYNTLMSAKFRVDEAWSGITVQLKRRHALVPNLVQAAKTAIGHEQAIIDKIVTARSAALEALASDKQADIAKAEAGLSQALGQFIAYTEDNPEITANENLLVLQKQLEETEDQVAAARRIYNGNVQAYNTRVASIPWNFVAGLNKLKPSQMFELDAAEMKEVSKDPSLDALELAVPPQQDRT